MKANFHTDVLKNHFEARVAKNESYSLRAYARDLNVRPSALSEILNSKKGLSEKSAAEIASRLGLNRREIELFVLSVKASHSRSQALRIEAQKKLNSKSAESIKLITSLEFEQASNWYHQAILELTELDDCDHSIKYFSKRLNLSQVAVKAAIDRMIKAGWLDLVDGKYVPSNEQSETTYDQPSVAIKAYHSELLKRADEALYIQDILSREFLNMTVAFSESDVKEAKETIREFQNRFAEEFYNKEKKKDSVYQLSIQLFRLDKKEI